jgi:hypothetical protein
MLLNLILYLILDMLNEIKIWRVRGELNRGNLSVEEVNFSPIRPMRRGIILHKDVTFLSMLPKEYLDIREDLLIIVS